MQTSDIRNVCLLGHGGEGKTSLTESLLFYTKAINRQGRVADGNTACDFDPEEIRRKISIGAAVAPVEHAGKKINILDTPGYFDFVGEVVQSLRVADLGVVVLSAKSGVSVGTEKAVKHLKTRKLPRMFYVSKLDEENADFYKTLDDLKQKFGASVCPLIVPSADGKTLIDLTKTPDHELYAELAEHVAEADETLMEKFFEGEAFTPEEIARGLSAGIADASVAPVVCGSAFNQIGTRELLDVLINYAPAPKADPTAPAAAIVFKTLSDQYGKFSFFKVESGKVTADASLTNSRTNQPEKLAHIYTVRGKDKSVEVKEVIAGDLGAVSKLSDTKTGDTLFAPGKPVTLPGIDYPAPTYALAFSPKVKGGEEKIATGLARMSEEDLTYKLVNNTETKQLVVTGQGDIQIDVLCQRLKNKYGVEVETSAPEVPYREKIRKKVKVQGRHKKQSGGHGQFGDVWIEFEPGEKEELEFGEKIFGGSVPKNFHPAVEKGLRDRISKGVLAGYPVVYLKATLVDGSYHDVDSSEMAFKTAAGIAYKNGLPLANPVLLEPIGSLKVCVPDSYTGDIMGDLNKRRGRVMGMNPAEDGDGTVIEAEAPVSEMHSYAIDLRSMTQGRGSYEFKFERYEEAPMDVQKKVIDNAKARLEEDDD